MLSTISSQHKSDDGSLEHFKSKKIVTDSATIHPAIVANDTIDNPLLKQLFLEHDITEENIFQEMKNECNRLYSFQNRWPMVEIKPESLAEAGFFYLQLGDKVQCPFCHVVIYNWTHGDKPLREHMKKSPKCPFLVGNDAGNIPILPGKCQQISLNPVSEVKHSSHSATASYKPKHPRMADIKRRILTYSNWPLSKPTPQQLAECGLYYTGIADVVICFFCDGALGNWEPKDDPWNEHSKFYPECSFLALAKSRITQSTKIVTTAEKNLVESKMYPVNGLPSAAITSEIIEQALDIFPEPLVLDAVKRKGGSVSSLQELCDDILELKQTSNHEPSVMISEETNQNKSKNGSANSDALLCTLCMDRERGVVFQPCHHFVSCSKCANLIANCPVCRRPITHKIKVYFS